MASPTTSRLLGQRVELAHALRVVLLATVLLQLASLVVPWGTVSIRDPSTGVVGQYAVHLLAPADDPIGLSLALSLTGAFAFLGAVVFLGSIWGYRRLALLGLALTAVGGQIYLTATETVVPWSWNENVASVTPGIGQVLASGSILAMASMALYALRRAAPVESGSSVAA